MTNPSWESILNQLTSAVAPLSFEAPVTHVYNPLVYADDAHRRYCRLFGTGTKEVVLLGMNPGPWGMAQTGVPFGDPEMVVHWLGIRVPVGRPEVEHPKRPIQGFASGRSEVSGQRLWGWAKSRFETPQRFFRRFWVANYCPLVFMEAGGRNRTPDKLGRKEKEPLFTACDLALLQTVERLRPRFVVGVGRFAAQRAAQALGDKGITVGWHHPSQSGQSQSESRLGSGHRSGAG